jgi:hypothetical protein
MQLAAYRYAEFYVADDGTEQPMPQIDRVVVIHVRADGYDVVPVRADEHVFTRFRHVGVVARAAEEAKSWVGDALTPAHPGGHRMTELEIRRERTAIATVADQAHAPSAAVGALMEWAQSASAAHEIAQHLVRTSFVPEGFRGKPDEATAAILAGIEVGLQPMAALRSFDVIQGTAAPRANTLRAIVQSQGHEVWVVESTETRAIVAGRRRGSSQEQTSTWTLDRAKRLGLTGKKNWQAQPQAMLVARATSELCRLIASDAILGLPYSIEELVDGDDLTVDAAVVPMTPKRRTARRAAAPATQVERVDAPAAPQPVHDEPPLDDEPASRTDSVTPPQLTKIAAQMGDLGITDRGDALAYVADVIGRPVESRNDLSAAEASRLIEHMALALGEVPPTAGEA